MSAAFWRDDAPLAVMGTGFALPGAPVATEALLEGCAPWIDRRTMRAALAVAHRLGVRMRHLCRPFAAPIEPPRPGEANPDLAAAAVRAALAQAGLRPAELGYLIGHTATPAQMLPPNIGQVAGRLGYAGPFVELRQACTGFANALVLAQGLLRAGAAPVAIVGSETGSLFFDPRRAAVDPAQRVNLVQMGDGAGAIVLGRDTGRGPRLSRAFYGQAGRGRGAGLSMAAGAAEFAHDFAAVRRNGRDLLARCVEAADAVGALPADRVLPHQANGRLAGMLAPLLGLAPTRFVVNADRVGNTGSAAIWLALAQLRARLSPGESVAVLGLEATDYMFGGFRYEH